jgi:hypothetical protein
VSSEPGAGQGAIDAFNADVARYNKAVESWRIRQKDFNDSIDLHNISVGLYNVRCAKKYYADDMEEARKLAGI